MEQNTKKPLNLLQLLTYILIAIIATLVLTGGYYSKNFELAQLNIFGLLLGLVALCHIKIYGKTPDLPAFLEKLTSSLLKKKSLAIVFGAFTTFWTTYQLIRHAVFQSNAFDLSFIDHAVWSTANLFPKTPLLHSSICRNGTYFSEHFSPILLFFVPFYKLIGHPVWLFFFSAFFIGSGSVLLFRLSQKLNNSVKTSMLLAIAFLLLPSVRGALSFDPREDLFYIPLLFLSIQLIYDRRFRHLLLLLPILFLVKENAPIVTALLGFWIFFTRNKSYGATITATSLVWFVLLNNWIMPQFAGSTQSVMAGRLAFLGSDSRSILNQISSHPIDSIFLILQNRFGKNAIKYFLSIWSPVLILFAANRFKTASKDFYFLCGIGLVLTLMNIMITPQMIGFHYELILLPFVATALAILTSDFTRTGSVRSLAWLVSLSVLMVFGRSPILSFQKFYSIRSNTCFSKMTSKIKPELSIRTTSSLHTHLTHRVINKIYNNSSDLNEDVVLISEHPSLSLYATDNLESRLAGIEERGYLPIIKTKLISMWCNPKTCANYRSELELAVLEGVACFERFSRLR